jgi:hypothetical protein
MPLTRLGITPRHCPVYSPGEAIPATMRRCAVRPGSTPRHCATRSRTAGTPRPRKETAEPSKGDRRLFRARPGPCRDIGHAPAVTISPVRPSQPLQRHPRRCGNTWRQDIATPLLCPVRPLVSGTLESARGRTPNWRPLHRHPRSRSWTDTGCAMTSRQKQDSPGRPSTPRHCAPYCHT